MNAGNLLRNRPPWYRSALALSFLVNLALSTWLWLQIASHPTGRTTAPQTTVPPSSLKATELKSEGFPQQPKAEPIRRETFHWRQLESTDYPTYIANLRAIGCPDRTVREIISADVADLFAEKRQALGLNPSGSSPGSYSRQEEAELVATLFGEQLKTAAQAGLVDEGVPGTTQEIVPPLAFQTDALQSLNLSEEQWADVALLRSEFVREIGGENQDPRDPEYRRRWLKAQPKLDEMVIGVVGRQALVEMDPLLP